MAPGTHHLIAYIFSEGYDDPAPNPYEYRDMHIQYLNGDVLEMIENLTTLQEHTFVFGTQWPMWNYELPTGVALKVNSNYGLDISTAKFISKKRLSS